MMTLFRSLILLPCLLLVIGCQEISQDLVIVVSNPLDKELRLSEVKFQRVQLEGTPQEVIQAVNLALQKAGFKVGLITKLPTIESRAALDLQDVTLRELLDAMCLQLNLSYWDDEAGQTLHLQGGLTSSFDVYMRDEFGFYQPAGPRASAPPGYDLLPLRNEYFNRKIQELEAALQR